MAASARPGHEYKTLSFWMEYAKMLENACFDGIFFADNIGYHDVYKGSVAGALKDAAQIPANDPAYLIPAMAAASAEAVFLNSVSKAGLKNRSIPCVKKPLPFGYRDRKKQRPTADFLRAAIW